VLGDINISHKVIERFVLIYSPPFTCQVTFESLRLTLNLSICYSNCDVQFFISLKVALNKSVGLYIYYFILCTYILYVYLLWTFKIMLDVTLKTCIFFIYL